MKQNKSIYYIMIFIVIILIFGLLESSIITSDLLSRTSEKLFWSAMNVLIFLGIPIGVISIIKLNK